MAVLYIHKRLDTAEIFYVGIGKTAKRAYCKQGRTAHWRRVVAKAGYTVEILNENLTWEEACREESKLIAFYGRLDSGKGFLINKTDGGEGQLGAIISKERRLKQSKLLKGRPGKLHTDQAKQLIAQSKVGVPRSQETKELISKSSLGKIPWNKGKTMLKGWSPLINKKKIKIKCPYCEIHGSPNNMNRWHFENCKNKRL